MVSSTAIPAAVARGLPPKVEPWLPGTKAAATSFCSQERPDGETVPQGLRQGDHIRDHLLLLAGEERSRPADSRLDLVDNHQEPRSSQIFLIPCRYPGAGMMTPLSPWIGSTMTPQVLSVTAASSAGRSL